MMNDTPSVTVDAKGLVCPLPVLRARKALAAMAPGEVLAVETTDPAAKLDFPVFCSTAGHDLLAQERRQGPAGPVLRFLIRRGAASGAGEDEA